MRTVRTSDGLTHFAGFDLQLGGSFGAARQSQGTLLHRVQELGDGVIPLLRFHPAPGHQLILLHQVVHSVHKFLSKNKKISKKKKQNKKNSLLEKCEFVSITCVTVCVQVCVCVCVCVCVIL